MIAPPVEIRVDIILVKDNLCPGVADADILDVRPVPALSRGIQGTRDIYCVIFVHVLIEGARVPVIMDVVRGVDIDLPLTLS